MKNKRILRPQEEIGQFGFVDKRGNWIINPQYDDVDVFRENVCWVMKDKKWGLIDSEGNFIISPQYQGAREFNKGLANIKIADKWGVIDKEGKLIIRPEFDFIDSFKDGIAYVKNNGKYGFVFIENNRIITPVYDDVRGFSEGLAAVLKDGVWGYIDTTGQRVIKPQYYYAGKFRNGQAYVEYEGLQGSIDKNGNELGIFQEKEYDTKWSYEDEPWYDRGERTLHGFIDKKGKLKIKPKFRWSSSFDEKGLAIVEIDRKWGIIDTTGAYIIEPKYDYIDWQDDDIYKVGLKGKEYLIDIYENLIPFKIILPPKHFYEEKNFEGERNQDFETIIKDEKYGIKNKDGKIIIPPCYDHVYFDIQEEVFLVMKGNKWGIVDKNGEIIINPIYDISRFSEGLAAIKIKGKWGFVNNKGDLVIPAKFDSAEDFKEGVSLIMLNRKNGYIDKEGKYVIKPIFDNIGTKIQNGYVRVALNEKEGSYVELWGLMDTNGKYVIPPIYEYIIHKVSEDMARVREVESFGFIDCKTLNRIPPIFNYVWDFSNGLAHIRLTEKQIENGVLNQDMYIEGLGKQVSVWQETYDNWVEPPLTEIKVLSDDDENFTNDDEDGLPF